MGRWFMGYHYSLSYSPGEAPGSLMTERRSIGDVFRDAVMAHRAGRLAEAEAGYHEVLRHQPGEPKALHFVGLLLFHRGDLEGGIEHVLRSVRSDPRNPRGWNDLGGMFGAAGRTLEARDSYRRATEVAPGNAAGWYNLGVCLRKDGDLEGAISSLRAAIACATDYSRAYEALGMLLYQSGRLNEAASVYSDWYAREPANPKAIHMAAAMSGSNAPSRASDEYVRMLFDEAAEGFDTSLERLEYRAPAAIAKALVQQALAQQAGGKMAAVLDAGCGTGLCGPLIRELCGHLVGVDLSQRMIERARARNCYDELVVAELTAFFRQRPRAFDAVVCADTLMYFGALEPVFAAASASLCGGGWFIFTLESLDSQGADGYRLEVHGRYAHSESYARHALVAANFGIAAFTRDTFRRERDQEVPGFLVIARTNP
jgi:predicted TPR repeat methyltransferase